MELEIEAENQVDDVGLGWFGGIGLISREVADIQG